MHASGRPLIFWEQQVLEKSRKNHKKTFSYKKKQQKFPLRPTGPYVYASTVEPPTMSTAGRNQRNTATNGKTVGVRVGKKVGPKPPPVSSTQAGKDKKPAPDSGTVTLTQNQLNAILETIGRLTMNNERRSSKPNNTVKDRVQSTKSKSSSQGSATQTRATMKSREIRQPASLKTAENSKLLNSKKDVTTRHGYDETVVDSSPDKKKRVKSGSIRNSKETDSKVNQQQPPIATDVNVSDTKTSDPETNVAEVVIDAQAAGDGHLSSDVIDKPSLGHTPLTMTEMKRLQWQREKAEQACLNSFNPWGRPGAGAPIKDISGNLLNDFNTRKDGDSPRQAYVAPPRGRENGVEHLYQHSGATKGQTQAQMQGTDVMSMNTSDAMKSMSSVMRADPMPVASHEVQPPAIRSNFSLGAAAPDGDRFISVKERERKQWLDQLDKQRDEERLRKQQEKIRWQEADARLLSDHPPVVYRQQPVNHSAVNHPAVNHPAVNHPAVNHPAVNHVGGLNTSLSPRACIPVEPLASTFIHGQNVMIDTETMNELGEKRKRHLEHQEFICKQVEEKRLQKEMDKKRKLAEEIDSETRLQEQRNEQHKQFASEQQRLKEKQQADQKRFDTMTEVMAKAREEAERAKHERHVRKLKDGGHDVSQLCNSFEERPPMPTSRSEANPKQNKCATEMWSPRSVANEVHDTASQITSDHHGIRREFATQTVERELENSSRESTHIEYQPDVVKVVRVKSPPTSARRNSGPGAVGVNSRGSSRGGGRSRGATGRGRGADPAKQKTGGLMKISDRPRWGAPVNTAGPKKQSDHDASYEKRRKRAASVERRKELQALANICSPRVAGVTTVASRARSRSPPLNSTVAPSVANEALKRARDEFSQDLYSVYERRQTTRVDSEPTSSRKAEPGLKSHRSQGFSSHRSELASQSDTAMTSPTAANKHKTKDKYVDKQPVNAPLQNGDFVPFIRSMNVLDPGRADSPFVVSRENTANEKARQAYEHAPATYGTAMVNHSDARVRNWKDPLCNPSLVTDHPTARQDRILAQLSDLRKGLKQKQREVEIGLAACGVAPPPPGGAGNRSLLHADE